MLLTVFSVGHLDPISLGAFSLGAWGSGTLISYGILASIIIIIGLSSQRWLLKYMIAGIAYWLSVESMHYLLVKGFDLSNWNSYVTAMAVSWLPLAGWVLYRALRYEDVSKTVQKERERAAARYVEHSPIYDDHYQPRF